MKRLIIVAALTLGIVLATGIVWAVQLTLNPDDVARVGGTGMVSVLSPTNNTAVQEVTWTYDQNFDIDGATVVWYAAEGGQYDVAVIVYDDTGGLITSGSTTVTVANADDVVVTTVGFGQPVPPEQLYNVEVVIIQTQP